jgi:hypothetical protein
VLGEQAKCLNRQRGSFEAALQSAEQGQMLAERHQDWSGFPGYVVLAQFIHAEVLQCQGEFSKAQKVLPELLGHDDGHDPYGVVMRSIQRTEILGKLGEKRDAEAALQVASELMQRHRFERFRKRLLKLQRRGVR